MNIDEFTPESFDIASREWRKNKISIGNGSFGYRCEYIHTNKKRCNKIVSLQQPKIKYRIREDWIIETQKNSLDYCKKHQYRGPIQRLLKKIE
jgi:hypothetical protein